MPALLERLRDDLLPDYDVEHALGHGGQGWVFRARDVKLDRPVAIKVLRPELATAESIEEFLAEARTLAHLVHPNVVPIHVVGEAAHLGLPYYVMDLMRGETLTERLARGPLEKGEALKLGRDLLAAAEAVHELDLIHRDIKPGNIFLEAGRAVLGDFGIAQSSWSDRDRTGKVRGTPGYMPPEQAFGKTITMRTDLYAIAMVVYEAYTGRQWDGVLPDSTPDWRGVPRLQRRVLQRGLAWQPEGRWPDAQTFRRRLWKTRTSTYRLQAGLLAAAGVVGMVLVYGVTGNGESFTSDLAVLPFESPGAADPYLGSDFASLLAGVIRPMDVADPVRTFRIWDSTPTTQRMKTDYLLEHLRSERLVFGTVEQRGTDLEVDVSLVSRSDTIRLGPFQGKLEDRPGLACSVALRIAQRVGEAQGRTFRCLSGYTGKLPAAITAFQRGDRAAAQNRWRDATARYAEAMALDTTFALAAVRHYIAHSWGLTGRPPDSALGVMLAQQHEGLPIADSLVLRAMTAPGDRARLAAYEEALEQSPGDVWLAYLHADLVFHRGPFLGRSLDDAEQLWSRTAALDSAFSPVWHHLTWVRLLLGDEEGAASALEQFARWAGPPEQVGNWEKIFEFALLERFAPPQESAVARRKIFEDPDLVGRIGELLRLAPAFGLTRTQLELAQMFGNRLAQSGEADPMQLATVVEAEALARIASGEVTRGLELIDSVRTLLGSEEARLQAAAWRLVGPSVGLPGISAAAVSHAEQELADIDVPRAWWALGVSAAVRGNLRDARKWLDRLGSAAGDTTATRLGTLLEAYITAAEGDLPRAIALSEPLLQYDSAAHGGDPFARSALHAWRGDWLDELGQDLAADSSRRWYLHTDHLVSPVGVAVPEEIDWALGPYAALQRVGALRAANQEALACPIGRWLEERWIDPDPVVAEWRDSVTAFLGERCGA